MPQIPKESFVIPPDKQWLREIRLDELKQDKYSLSRFCREIEEFSYSPYAYDMDSFATCYQIKPRKLYLWRQAIPELEQEFQDMQEQIHINRRMLYADRGIAEGNFNRYAAAFSSVEKEIDKYHDERKRCIAQGDTNKEVIVTIEQECKGCKLLTGSSSNEQFNKHRQDHGSHMRLAVGSTQADGAAGDEAASVSVPEDVPGEVSP